MQSGKKLLATVLTAAMLTTGCTRGNSTGDSSATYDEVSTTLDTINNSSWQYNEDDGVYWQVGIVYCENPVSTEYESLGIFVPAEYMDAADNGDGTYTCEINTEGNVEGYTAETAPIVIPVDTPGYSAMAAPTDYVSDASSYTSAGFIYVNAGCRGRDDGAPAGVTDLKAAVRFVRYNEGVVPGSMDNIFTFGMSGGGAQSALMGATGDSELYTSYLEAIGAVQGVSDAVAGSMCWCPITNLDYADEAYEWNLGSTRTGLDDGMQTLSDNMAAAFAEYVNELGLTQADGTVLTLEESESGIYQAGSYYEYIKGVIEQSLNNFLSDTTFPYTSGGSSGIKDFQDNFSGEFPDDLGEGELPDDIGKGDRAGKDAVGRYIDANGELPEDGINRIDTGTMQTESKTYQTAQEYIDGLNADGEWISYDSETNTVSITSVADFVANCKPASKNVGAFDDLSEAQGENTLFGYGDGKGAHFDAVMAELLEGTEYEDAYAEDLCRTDAQGNTVDYRLNMYNPMYYLDDYYEGYQTANVARYWRIRTGINQGDTALTTEVNLALALESYGGTEVDFETVWGQGHVTAERTGDATSNFIEWVNECVQAE